MVQKYRAIKGPGNFVDIGTHFSDVRQSLGCKDTAGQFFHRSASKSPKMRL